MPSSNPPRDGGRGEVLASPVEAAVATHGLPDSDWRTVMDRELTAALASFAAGVAHEARNQIFAVTATLDAFEARLSGSGATPPHVGVMREDLQRLTALMRGLAEFGHPSPPVLAFGDLRAAARDALLLARASAEPKHVTLRAQLDDDRATAWFDRERLSLALRSALEHAIRRSPENAFVELSLARGSGDEGLIAVTVADHGAPLAREHLDRYFEPFFTPNRAARGLELALAKRIIEQHGGTVQAKNRAPTGICLTLFVPGSSAP